MTKLDLQISAVYNQAILSWTNITKAPTEDDLEQYLQLVRDQWAKDGNKILSIIQHTLGYEWEIPLINAYIVPVPISFSSPLTLGYKVDAKVGFDVLCHELIHVYISQPTAELKERVSEALSKYSEYNNKLTAVHVLVHAMHKALYLELNWQARLEKDITRTQKFPEYKKAWNIVEHEDFQKILNSLKK